MKVRDSNPGTGHIVAMGGCGFSTEIGNTLIDDFVLSLSRRSPARVCFVPTASADSAQYLVKFYRAFSKRAIPTDLTLFDPPALPRNPGKTSDIGEFIKEQDVIYVGGGNTANLLTMWRVHGIDELMREAWARGTIMCGVSAGMICWFHGGITDSFGGTEFLNDGLALIDGVACPHYDAEGDRRIKFQSLIQSTETTALLTNLWVNQDSLIQTVARENESASEATF